MERMLGWFVSIMCWLDLIFTPNLVEHNETVLLWQELCREAGINTNEGHTP